MTTNCLDTDVVVIGGGPGGSTTATMLARKGLRVLLLERDRFPREHIGESLLPASMPVLEELGVLPEVQRAGFLEKWGATMLWGSAGTPWSWYFKETNPRWPHTYQVWRARFDQILLDNSRAHGVDVCEGHAVQEVLFEGERAVGVRFTSGAGDGVARARWVVDASGQGALLGHRLRLRRWDSFFQNLAVYAYYEGARRLPAPDQNNLFIESYAHGWLWNIPLHTGWMSVGAVVDSRVGGEGIRRSGAGAFLAEQIAQGPYASEMLRDARLIHGPAVVKDWSYLSDEVVGDGYILVGDAACFVDPLFSSGVHLALTAGVLAAAYVASALKDPTLREPAARVYKDLYYRQYGHFRELAKLFYASNRSVESYFWEARRILGLDDDAEITPRQAFLHAVAGQSPLGYERAVIERGEAPAPFWRGVRAVESARAERQAQLNDLMASGRDAHPPLLRLVPRPCGGVRVEHKPVIADGEFVHGQVLVTEGYPEGTPCSPFVAALVEIMDGHTSVAGLADRLGAGADDAQRDQIARLILSAVGILYVDGAVDLGE